LLLGVVGVGKSLIAVTFESRGAIPAVEIVWPR
jgi:hypothetical protein